MNQEYNLITYLRKLRPYSGYILFVSIFLFVLLPQFLVIKQPLIMSTDTHLYIMKAKDIYNFKLPFEGYNMEFPYGFSVFIALNYFLGGNLFTVVITQTILQFSLALWLLQLVHRHCGIRVGFVLSVLFALFFTISEMVLWNSLIYTESFFISSLIFTGGHLFQFLNTDKKKHLFLTFLGLFGAMQIRSNAIFLFVIPFLLFFMRKNSRKNTLVAIMLLLVSLSASNLIFRGSFSPIETKRYIEAIKQLKSTHVKGNIMQEKKSKKKRTVASQAIKLFTHLGNPDMGNHYYYRLPNLLIREKQKDFQRLYVQSADTIKYITPGYPFDHQAYFNFAVKGISDQQNAKELSDIDKYPRHPWLLVLNYYHFIRFVIRNHLFTALFYGSILYCLFLSFKDKHNRLIQTSLLFGLIHLSSIFLLALHTPRDTSLSRYAIVTELFCYLTIVITASEFFRKRKSAQ